MVEPGSPASSVHLPWFIAGPGQTDVLLVIMGVVIASLLLALYMPLFQLSSVLGQ